MKRIIFALAALISAFSANAATLQDAGLVSTSSGYARNPANYFQGGAITAGTINNYTTRSADINGITLSRTINANLPAERTIPVILNDSVKLPRSAISTTAARLIKGGLLNLATGAIADMLIQQGLQWQQSTQQWLTTTQTYIGNCNQASSYGSPYSAGGVSLGACLSALQTKQYFTPPKTCNDAPVVYSTSLIQSNPPLYQRSIGCNMSLSPSFQAIGNFTDTSVQTNTSDPATQTQLQTALNNATNWTTKASPALDQITQTGQGVDATGNEVATLTSPQPNYSSAPKTTTTIVTNPDGSTTTYQDVNVLRATPTITGSTVGTQVVNWNIQNITNTTNNGSTTQTKTEDVPQDQQKDCTQGDPTCSPGTLTKPDLDSGLQTFGELTQAFKARVAASQVAQSLTGVANSIPSGGTCPTFNLAADYHGVTFGGVMSAHCTILNQNYAVIHAAFLVGFALSALIVFFKA